MTTYNDFNLNISRYVRTAEDDEEIDLAATHVKFIEIDEQIRKAEKAHKAFQKELGLPPLP